MELSLDLITRFNERLGVKLAEFERLSTLLRLSYQQLDWALEAEDKAGREVAGDLKETIESVSLDLFQMKTEDLDPLIERLQELVR